MAKLLTSLLIGICLLNFWACRQLNEEAQLKKAEEAIQVESLARDIQILASDEFEGRAPASEGEKKTP